MLTRTQRRQAVAVALVVVGLLLLFGSFSLALLVAIGAIAGVALGVVLVLDDRQESRILGVTLLVVGALLLLAPRFFKSLVEVLNVLGGVALVAIGLWLLWNLRQARPAWR